MVVLLTCKNEEIRSNIEALECSQHYTSISNQIALLYINFSEAQGQITLELVAVSY